MELGPHYPIQRSKMATSDEGYDKVKNVFPGIIESTLIHCYSSLRQLIICVKKNFQRRLTPKHTVTFWETFFTQIISCRRLTDQ